jgi:hypothetical protein
MLNLESFKGLVAWYHSLCFFYTYIYSITFIQYIHPSSFAELPLHLLLAGQLSEKNLLVSRAGNRTRDCLTPSRRTTNWATPHPTEQCLIQLSYTAPLLSYAAPYWATPHPYWSTPHPTELRRTLLCKRTHLFRSEYGPVFSERFKNQKLKGTVSRDC